MKRFYKIVSVGEGVAGYEIHLDGRSVKTPSGALLATSSKTLADALMGEWAAQDPQIVPDTMPLTQLLTTALDRVAAQREEMTHALIAYLNTDLICYRATQPAIADRQAAAWDPWLQWFIDRFDAALAVTEGLRALTQPEEAQTAVRVALGQADDLRFTVIQLVTSLTGSLVLGLAFAEGAATPEQAFEAANVDEIYKSEIYHEDVHGRDPQQEKRERSMRVELDAARRFLALTDSAAG
jgi:chaperone required for assembly of F1-ATPase